HPVNTGSACYRNALHDQCDTGMETDDTPVPPWATNAVGQYRHKQDQRGNQRQPIEITQLLPQLHIEVITEGPGSATEVVKERAASSNEDSQSRRVHSVECVATGTHPSPTITVGVPSLVAQDLRIRLLGHMTIRTQALVLLAIVLTPCPGR